MLRSGRFAHIKVNKAICRNTSKSYAENHIFKYYFNCTETLHEDYCNIQAGQSSVTIFKEIITKKEYDKFIFEVEEHSAYIMKTMSFKKLLNNYGEK